MAGVGRLYPSARLLRLRAENFRLSRLLDLRGQDTAPAPGLDAAW